LVDQPGKGIVGRIKVGKMGNILSLINESREVARGDLNGDFS
jgi:hypothetical protein